MTDMRATERLLDVIEESLRGDVAAIEGGWAGAILDAREAVEELRRRGDTLVRASDLRLAIEGIGDAGFDIVDGAVVERLDNALGGRMR